jgi:hypothetical protein
MVSVRFAVLVCLGVPESCAWNVTALLVTAAVGVPVIAPVEAFRFKPAGSEPLVIDQLYGVVPPLAVSVVL